MAHSIEIRVPYLDHRLTDVMARVPPHWKLRGLRDKDMLRSAFSGLLPEEIQRRPKQPYRAPIAGALLDPKRSGRIAEMLSPSRIDEVGLFDGKKVGRLLQKLGGSTGASEFDSMLIAGIASTQLVHDVLIKNRRGGSPAPPPDLVVDRRAPCSIVGALAQRGRQ